jgi:hypothetical protein
VIIDLIESNKMVTNFNDSMGVDQEFATEGEKLKATGETAEDAEKT